MPSRYDTMPLIPDGSSQAEKANDDYLPARKLSRRASELFEEAYRHFSNLEAPPAQSARGPPLPRIIEEPGRYRRPYAEERDLPRNKQPSPPLNGRASAAPELPKSTFPGRGQSFSNFSRGSVEPLFRGSFSQPLDLLPYESPLESAPPPELCRATSPGVGRLVVADFSRGVDYSADEADDDIAPLALSDLIHVRDLTPTPGSPHLPVQEFRRASTSPSLRPGPSFYSSVGPSPFANSPSPRSPMTNSSSLPGPSINPSLLAGPSANPSLRPSPSTPQRSRRSTAVSPEEAEASQSGGVRRSRRVQDKIGTLRANGQEVRTIYSPDVSPRRTRRK
ncbi:hypothetical protein BD414DRAFT_495658 [Trametes punicea]|nr:hypothetical protein BD414DRAFT_495658 [Trametes punicea]